MVYDYKKTIFKMLKQLLYIVVVGTLAISNDNVWLILLQPVLIGIENYLKNAN